MWICEKSTKIVTKSNRISLVRGFGVLGLHRDIKRWRNSKSIPLQPMQIVSSLWPWRSSLWPGISARITERMTRLPCQPTGLKSRWSRMTARAARPCSSNFDRVVRHRSPWTTSQGQPKVVARRPVGLQWQSKVVATRGEKARITNISSTSRHQIWIK